MKKTTTQRRISERLLLGIMNGEIAKNCCKPHQLKLTRHKSDQFSLTIVNSDDEELASLAEITLHVRNSCVISDIHRAFEITLIG